MQHEFQPVPLITARGISRRWQDTEFKDLDALALVSPPTSGGLTQVFEETLIDRCKTELRRFATQVAAGFYGNSS
jgi:hypothetical protein